MSSGLERVMECAYMRDIGSVLSRAVTMAVAVAMAMVKLSIAIAARSKRVSFVWKWRGGCGPLVSSSGYLRQQRKK